MVNHEKNEKQNRKREETTEDPVGEHNYQIQEHQRIQAYSRAVVSLV